MKYIDEFRDGKLARGVVEEIKNVSRTPANLMEVCGSHTVALFKGGLRALLPSHLRLISGPGCPVCVTAKEDVDWAYQVALKPEVIFATFGDMLRVPGSYGNLQDAGARGAEIKVVYSPMDALSLARQNPSKKVIFFAVGFETTSPAIASTLLRAKAEGLENFYLLVGHKLVPPALAALVQDPACRIQGFIAPGHVSVILGTEPYQFLAKQHRIPVVITGFEALDMLEGILFLVRQIEAGRAEVEIQYRRTVTPQGNLLARQALAEVFEPEDAYWRGIGVIPQSGLRLRGPWSRYDAKKLFPLEIHSTPDPAGCSCGEVLKGLLLPSECPLFAGVCTPEEPIGPCMVSTEGSCAAYYRFKGLKV